MSTCNSNTGPGAVARSALRLLPLLLVVDAFQPSITSPLSSATTTTTTTNRGSRSHLQAAPLLHELPLLSSVVVDPQELSTHAHAVHGFLQHHTSLFLSDASAAVLDLEVLN